MGERLAGDPFMAAARHRLLTRLTSIRSYSEILRDNVDLEVARRQRFVGVLVDESEHLTTLVNEVFDFLADDGTPGLVPAAIAGGGRCRPGARPQQPFSGPGTGRRCACAQALAPPPSGLYAAMVEALQREHGVRVHIAEDGPGQDGPGSAAPDLPGRSWSFPRRLTQESRRLSGGAPLALLACRPAIEARLTEAGDVSPAEADLYRR